MDCLISKVVRLCQGTAGSVVCVSMGRVAITWQLDVCSGCAISACPKGSGRSGQR